MRREDEWTPKGKQKRMQDPEYGRRSQDLRYQSPAYASIRALIPVCAKWVQNMHQAGWHRRLIIPVPAATTDWDGFFLLQNPPFTKRR